VNGGHLGREHHLDLILWLDAFDDGKPEIKRLLVNLATLRIRIG
jgi:hypothetical protein